MFYVKLTSPTKFDHTIRNRKAAFRKKIVWYDLWVINQFSHINQFSKKLIDKLYVPFLWSYWRFRLNYQAGFIVFQEYQATKDFPSLFRFTFKWIYEKMNCWMKENIFQENVSIFFYLFTMTYTVTNNLCVSSSHERIFIERQYFSNPFSIYF